jgi:methionyl-tRNA formyltransferase
VVGAVLSGDARGTPAPLARAAERLGIEVHPAGLVREEQFATFLETKEIDLLLNVHSLFVIRPDALRAPAIGSFNLHPGPLPRYAGLNAPSWAIYHGEHRHGTTVHWMSDAIDAGPIAYQAMFDIAPEDTGLSVAMKCVRLGIPLIAKVVEAAAGRAAIPRIEQRLNERTYFPPGPPHGGRVEWAAPARRIVDFVRAADYLPFASPWGHPRTSMGIQEVEITKASSTGEPTNGPRPGIVGEIRGRGALVAAADEWVLIERARVETTTSPAGEILSPGMQLGT